MDGPETSATGEDPALANIHALQRAIDEIDAEIVDLLVTRFTHSHEIGVVKAMARQVPIDPGRVARQRDAFLGRCADRGLDPKMSETIIAAIQDAVMADRLR